MSTTRLRDLGCYSQVSGAHIEMRASAFLRLASRGNDILDDFIGLPAVEDLLVRAILIFCLLLGNVRLNRYGTRIYYCLILSHIYTEYFPRVFHNRNCSIK
ncbi:hypothetical protein Syun_017762 [Stephania yunnanensis]|uniref:Uncharacterized protein n=1 Tax=Stephania yunnanensis TaxID=152371 RepID=A0AAP0P5F4_9MAGN